MRLLRVSLLLFLLLAPSTLSHAHSLGQSYIFLRIYDHSIEGRLEITVEDLERVLSVSLRPSGQVTLDDIQTHLDSILAYVTPRFYVGTAGRALPLRFDGSDIRRIEIADYVLLNFTADSLAQIPEVLELEYSVLFDTDADHRNLLVIEHNWKTATFNNERAVSLVFSPLNRRQTLDLSSSSFLRGLLGIVQLGTWHIWIGLDHILFLLALVLPAVLERKDGRWKPVASFRTALINIVSIVTFFTIAHSITLSLAALEVIQLPSTLVESIIAASIAIAALNNLYSRFQVREWGIAFVFGLFHGLGFASVLTHLGLQQQNLVLSLLGFNLGVEIGQVVIICALFPLLYSLRRTHLYFPILRYGSVFLIVVALSWFAERAFGLAFSRPVRHLLRGGYHTLIDYL